MDEEEEEEEDKEEAEEEEEEGEEDKKELKGHSVTDQAALHHYVTKIFQICLRGVPKWDKQNPQIFLSFDP